MIYADLENGGTAIEKLYSGAKGALKLKARRVLKPFREELESYREAVVELFKKEGGITRENGTIELPPPEEGNKVALEKRNQFIKELTNMKKSRVDIEVKEPFTLEDLAEIDISNPEIDQLVLLGIVEE